MKTKILWGMALCAIILLIPENAFAQERLNALVKKCETMDNVDMNIIQQKDKKTKEITKIIKSIIITNNKALVDEVLNAFAQDKKDAYKVIENKQSGRILPSLYQFSQGKMIISYTFSLINKDGTGATISVIERQSDEDDEDDD